MSGLSLGFGLGLSQRNSPSLSGVTGDGVVFENHEDPPVVTVDEVSGDITIRGKVKEGYYGKFLYPIEALQANFAYSVDMVNDLSGLANNGDRSGFGFVARVQNDFKMAILLGDGAGGVDASIVSGTPPNGWNKQTGHTITGSATTNGTQHAADIQFVTGSDGTTFDFNTSGDDQESWDLEVDDQSFSPFDDVDDAGQLGFGGYIHSSNAGSYVCVISWSSEEAAAANPYWAITLFQSGFEGTNGQTSPFLDDTGDWTLTANGGGQLSSTQAEYGDTAAFAGPTGGGWITGTSAEWGLSNANSDEFFFEFSVYYLNAPSTEVLFTIDEATGGLVCIWFRIYDTGELGFLGSKTGSGFTVNITSSGAGITNGSWFKVAAEKNASGTIRIYVGGDMVAKNTPADSIFFSDAGLRLRVNQGFGTPQNVWIDNVRILKGAGAARVDSDSGYTPETGPFPIG